MAFRLALITACYSLGNVLGAECTEGTCDDDSVLMQMDQLHMKMSTDEKMAISNLIENLERQFRRCETPKVIKP